MSGHYVLKYISESEVDEIMSEFLAAGISCSWSEIAHVGGTLVMNNTELCNAKTKKKDLETLIQKKKKEKKEKKEKKKEKEKEKELKNLEEELKNLGKRLNQTFPGWSGDAITELSGRIDEQLYSHSQTYKRDKLPPHRYLQITACYEIESKNGLKIYLETKSKDGWVSRLIHPDMGLKSITDESSFRKGDAGKADSLIQQIKIGSVSIEVYYKHKKKSPNGSFEDVLFRIDLVDSGVATTGTGNQPLGCF